MPIKNWQGFDPTIRTGEDMNVTTGRQIVLAARPKSSAHIRGARRKREHFQCHRLVAATTELSEMP